MNNARRIPIWLGIALGLTLLGSPWVQATVSAQVTEQNRLALKLNEDGTVSIPLRTQRPGVQVESSDGRVSIQASGVPAARVIQLIAEATGLNVVITGDLNIPVTLNLQDAPVDQALNAVLELTGHVAIREGGLVKVVPMSASSNQVLPGTVVRVFRLRYVRANNIRSGLDALKSPRGVIQIIETPAVANVDQPVSDVLLPRDTIVVSDLPEYVERIAAYIREVDVPPEQVMLETRILEVKLARGIRTGFQFLGEFEPGSKVVTFRLNGFASANPTQGFAFTVEGGELNTILDLLETTADAKTLAAPRLMVTHGQQARIQIGRSISYRVTTVTEVAQLEDVRFLDTGIVLRLVPYIDRRGRVLMRLRPEVSQAEINEDTKLPDKTTTEVETTVLVHDGEGLVIGGLIQEKDIDNRSKLRKLADLRWLGHLFRRTEVDRERREIIIALVPYLYPGDEERQAENQAQVERVSYPLLEDDLRPTPRPWEPRLHQPEPPK